MFRFNLKTSIGLAVAGLAFAMFGGAAAVAGESESELVSDANKTIAAFEQTDPSIKGLLRHAPGYVVFPGVGKAGLGIGGAHGNGVLYEGGKPVGKAALTQLNIGAEAGAQKYGEVIVFEAEKDLARFKEGKFAFSGNVSAVALKSGVSGTAHFSDGVAVFTHGEKGLMYEASVGGQKFSYHPFGAK
jgi:lipid-binding SYLF domain-containing protein